MSGVQEKVGPRAVGVMLLRGAALVRASGGAGPPITEETYTRLTEALESWEASGTLAENGAWLVDFLAVDLSAYVGHMLGSRDAVEGWVREFGDEVCRVQQHAHPAGPTAIEILSNAVGFLDAAEEASVVRQVQVAASLLGYLRAEHEVEDVRELTLTLGLWAGGQLAQLMNDEAPRINAYLDTRAESS